jgi:hypothetical protein
MFLVGLLILALSLFSLAIVEPVIYQINPDYQMTFLTYFLIDADMSIQSVAPYFLAIIILLGLCIPVCWIFHRLRQIKHVYGSSEPECLVPDEPHTISINHNFLLCLGVGLLLLIEIYQHFRFTLPIGTDARIYIYQLETVTLGAGHLGAWRLINLLPTVLTFSPFFPFRLAGISWDSLIKIAPLALGLLYLFSTFIFVTKCTNSKKIAALSVVFTAVSLQTLATSAVLFKNLLSLSLLLLFLTCYFIHFVDGRKVFLYFCSALFLLICAQHAFTAIFLTIIVFLFIAVIFGYNFKNGLNLLKNTLKMSVPVPIVVFLLDLYNFSLYGRFEQPIFAFIPSIVGGSFSLESLSPVVWVNTFQKTWPSIFLDNAYLLFFALVSIFSLLYSIKHGRKRQFYFSFLMLSWITCVSCMLCVTNLLESYRFVLYYPFPILAAIGLTFIVERVRSYVKTHSFPVEIHFNSRSKWLSLTKYISLVLLCLVLLNGVLMRTNSHSYFSPYSLPDEELDALQWIKDEYSSQQTIFIMKPAGWSNNESIPHYWQWAAYFFLPDISNISLYVGNLASLFSGNLSQPLSSMSERPSYSKDVLSDYSILLVNSHELGTFYSPDIFEEPLLAQVHQNVYAVKNLSVSEIESWVTQWDIFSKTGEIVPKEIVFEDNSFSEWVPHNGFILNDSNVPSLKLGSNTTDMWIDRKDLSINSSAYNFLEIKADPDGATIALAFYDVNGALLGRYCKFPSWNGSRVFFLNLDEIVSGGTVSHIALVYSSKNSQSTCSLYYIRVFSL